MPNNSAPSTSEFVELTNLRTTPQHRSTDFIDDDDQNGRIFSFKKRKKRHRQTDTSKRRKSKALSVSSLYSLPPIESACSNERLHSDPNISAHVTDNKELKMDSEHQLVTTASRNPNDTGYPDQVNRSIQQNNGDGGGAVRKFQTMSMESNLNSVRGSRNPSILFPMGAGFRLRASIMSFLGKIGMKQTTNRYNSDKSVKRHQNQQTIYNDDDCFIINNGEQCTNGFIPVTYLVRGRQYFRTYNFFGMKMELTKLAFYHL